MERLRRDGVLRRAYATPAAWGICVASGEEIVWKWWFGELKCCQVDGHDQPVANLGCDRCLLQASAALSLRHRFGYQNIDS